MKSLERVKIARELAALAGQLKDAAGLAPLQRMRLARDIRVLLERLGATTAGPDLSEHADTLRAIAKGLRDNETLAELYGLIQEAVSALEAGGAMDDGTELAAQSAITHWAQLEEKTHG